MRTMMGQTISGGRLVDVVRPLMAGVAIATFCTVVTEAFPRQWILFCIAGLLLSLPALVVKDPRFYWLASFVMLVPLQGTTGKSVTKYFIDATELMDTLGIPSSSHVGITITPSDVIFIGLFTTWLIKLLQTNERLYFPRLSYLALLYLGWATIASLLKAPYPYLSSVALIQEYKNFLIFLYVANTVATGDMPKRLMSVLMWCLVIQVLLMMVSLITLSPQNPLVQLYDPQSALYKSTSEAQLQDVTTDAGGEAKSWGRRAGGSIDVEYLHFLIPLSFILLLTNFLNARKLFPIPLFILGIIGLSLTYSRAAFLGLGSAVTAILWLTAKRQLVSQKILASVVYCLVVLILIAAPSLYAIYQARPGNVAVRFSLWDKGLQLISANPIFGVGVNNSTAVKQALGEDIESEAINPIHNHYIVVAAETGIVGFVLYMTFFSACAGEAWSRSRSPNLDVACFSVAIFGSYIGLAAHLLTYGLGPEMNTMLWFYAGLIMALKRMELHC
jgi:hypothetical protein